MTVATFTFFHDFAEQLGKGTHDFSSHTFKAALTNTAPSAANDTTLSDITEVAESGGYVAGGYALESITWSRTANIAKLAIGDEQITATGGSIGPFQYAVINNASASGALVGYVDYGSETTLSASRVFDLDFNASAGVLTLTV